MAPQDCMQPACSDAATAGASTAVANMPMASSAAAKQLWQSLGDGAAAAAPPKASARHNMVRAE
eukprot:CAMPEP_0170447318 /NCGR_PEP_ID=MMETSP0117_2-20130122/50097_1 /TAXON_ID=400756 /ORGANISM="Durinskia baltica, Strain CSIRO CS-38" /LENGTH=63 /DNA_ID=CAMNT_0010708385 /DNA_START=19 /DNA_END=210 /DNA_ORIENTATION=-